MTLSWEREGARWPHRDRSMRVRAAGLEWHVQRFARRGSPVALLIHGTGASTHSWRGLAPLLHEKGLDVVAMDLPGHAFTRAEGGLSRASVSSLPGMAAAIAGLLDVLEVAPALLVGHSAGAAIACSLTLDHGLQPDLIVSLNGALVPWQGLPGRIFSPLARVFAATPLLPALFAHRASDPQVVARLLDSTGSKLDAEGEALYRILVSDRAHAAGALDMMAHWDLDPLWGRLHELRIPLALMVGMNDLTVPPWQADEVQRRLRPEARMPVVKWQALGHLAHEEEPPLVAEAIAACRREVSAACAR